jgi:hypothetical protein
MKFRAKTQAMPYIWLIAAAEYVGFWAYDHVHRPAHPSLLSTAYGVEAVFIVLVCGLGLLSQRFLYWEMDAAGLRQRSFKTRIWFGKSIEIPWERVTRVGLADYKRPASSAFEIDFTRFGPFNLDPRSHLLALPTDRFRFVETMRKFAPQARFDVEA